MGHIFGFSTTLQNSAVAFGRFDGMHIGHRKVIRKLTSYENPVLISFADDREKVLYTETEKEYVLKKLGIKNMMTVSAETYEKMDLSMFVRDYLIERAGAKTIVAGENFDRLDELKSICERYGTRLAVVPIVKDNGTEVTTALIRSYFPNGNMNDCLRLLGGAYVMIGNVVHGKGVGKKHAMPTANLGFAENKLWPVHGVYGTEVRIDDGVWKGMTNIGLRPSDDMIPISTCETYILDFNSDIYDKMLILEAYFYVRPVMQFRGLDEVREQIDRDIHQIEETGRVC